MIRSLNTCIIILLSFVSQQLSAFNSSDRQLLNDNKLNVFARQIEMSIESRNPYYFNLSFDSELILSRILDNQYTQEDSAFNQGFIDGISMSLDFGSTIVNEIGNSGTFKFIRSYTNEDGSWIVFRLLSENGINYHAYKVETIGDDYKITDGYFYLSGEKLSESIELIYNRNAAIFLQRENIDEEMIQALDELDKIKLNYSKGKINKAYKAWQEIPTAYRTMKSFQYTGLIIASGLNQETYLKIFEEYINCYPEEPGKYLIPLGGLLSQGCYEPALRCIDSLGKALETDPLLDFFRAKIYYVNGNLEKSKQFLAQVIEAIPDFEMGYLSLLNIYLTERNFEEATVLLDQMTLTFNTYKEDFYPFLTDFPDYLNSSIYKDWIDQ